MSTPNLIPFCDINSELFYVNVDRVQYAHFMPVKNNIGTERVYIRCGEGLIDAIVTANVAERIKTRLNNFAVF